MVCSFVSGAVLVWSVRLGVGVCSRSGVVYPGVPYAVMVWLGFLCLVVSFLGYPRGVRCRLPAAVSLDRWEPDDTVPVSLVTPT